ncbi:MAG: D-tyrosyl-tRNA(Tyr) deacylase [Clostridia bacterium]|nr:D-tyrosyl-tRNA(Tyr) deacylase [Clostridia bacterium]
MKLLVQRVKEANVKVDNKTVGQIEKGFLVLVGITHNDTVKEADYLAKKLINLRVFEDENQKMNLNIKDIEGKLLIVSQFTLYANCGSGNRPSFTDAAKPDMAEKLYEYFCKKCSEYDIEVQKGIFGADMKVQLINDGPVTILLEKNSNIC